ncbi:MAG: PilN domain-containing protein [Myxococcota bacterium]
MIRINLLPIRQTQKRQTVQQQLLVGAAVLIITLIGCIVWYAKVSSDAKALRQDIQKKTQELAQLDKIIGEINDLEAKKKELVEKQQIIERLRKGKTGPVRALDDLSTMIPGRVWVTDLKEKSGAVTIEGRAINHEDVSAFMKALQKSKYFTGVSLGYSKASTRETRGVTLYEFQITCAVNYSA